MDLSEKINGLCLQTDQLVTKREGYIDWCEYFMAVAVLAAKRSKDPSCQVGACIVNKDNVIVGVGDNNLLMTTYGGIGSILNKTKEFWFLNFKKTKKLCPLCDTCKVTRTQLTGYNGMPIGCSDDEFPWSKNTSSPLENKHLYVCHAEVNAILNKNSSDVKGCSIYVGLFPCNECAKVIIQSGIKEVVYLSDKNAHKTKYIASKRMFDSAKVIYKQFKPKRNKIEINFDVDWELTSPKK